MLNTIVHGTPSEQPPLVIAHGLFGSARNWGVVAKRLALGREVVAVDLRNHGDSFHDADHSYPALAADLAEVIEAHGGRADLLGHSMGGKAAMVLALCEPARLRRLIVVDIAPVAYDHSQLGHVQALRAVDLTDVARRADADPQLASEVPDPVVRAFLLQSLAVGQEGARWKLNLPVLETEMPRIMGFPEIDARYVDPVLLLTGGASDYVGPAHAAAIRKLFPAAEHVAIPGAGHWLHAEAPRPFVAAVEAFLAG